MTELNVDVGELMQIDAEVLLNALKMLTTDVKMKDCEVHAPSGERLFLLPKVLLEMGHGGGEEAVGYLACRTSRSRARER